MHHLKTMWHQLRGHRMTAVNNVYGNGVYIFCYECFNNGHDKRHFGYFQFAHPDSNVSNAVTAMR